MKRFQDGPGEPRWNYSNRSGLGRQPGDDHEPCGEWSYHITRPDAPGRDASTGPTGRSACATADTRVNFRNGVLSTVTSRHTLGPFCTRIILISDSIVL